MAADLYAETRALGVRVWDAGLPEWSRRIDDVVAGGATASEILMGLRWTLRQMIDGEEDLPADLRREAEGLEKRVDTALR